MWDDALAHIAIAYTHIVLFHFFQWPQTVCFIAFDWECERDRVCVCVCTEKCIKLDTAISNMYCWHYSNRRNFPPITFFPSLFLFSINISFRFVIFLQFRTWKMEKEDHLHNNPHRVPLFNSISLCLSLLFKFIHKHASEVFFYFLLDCHCRRCRRPRCCSHHHYLNSFEEKKSLYK